MIMITGSSGFIGKHLSDYLIEKGEDIIGLSRTNPYGLINHISDDINNIKEINFNLEGIVHLAGISRVKDGNENPIKCIDSNIKGTFNMLEHAKNKNAWFIYGGTVENENNIYGISKQTGEKLCEMYSKDIRTISLKFSSVYGSVYDNPNKLYPILLSKAKKGEDITITNPESLIDYIHINNVVEGIDKTINQLRKEEYQYKAIFMCSGNTIRIIDLARKVNNMFGNKSKIIIK